MKPPHKLAMIGALLLCGSVLPSSAATQYLAWRFAYHPALGQPLVRSVLCPRGLDRLAAAFYVAIGKPGASPDAARSNGRHWRSLLRRASLFSPITADAAPEAP